MHCPFGGDMLDRAVAQSPQIEASEKRLAATKNHACHGPVDLVDMARLHILPDRFDTTTDLHILVACGVTRGS